MAEAFTVLDVVRKSTDFLDKKGVESPYHFVRTCKNYEVARAELTRKLNTIAREHEDGLGWLKLNEKEKFSLLMRDGVPKADEKYPEWRRMEVQ